MSDIAGVIPSLDVPVNMAGRSSDLDAQSGKPALTGNIDASSMVGTESGNGVVNVSSWASAGTRSEMFCGLLFERIHILPSVSAMGFVMSDTTWNVEVWNSHTNEQKQLTTLNITGAGGLQLSGPLSAGGSIGSMTSTAYTATLKANGPATVANVATWIFAGEVASTLTVTGSRLTVFSVEIDWSDGFEEWMEYATNIIPAHSTKEQRIQLRTSPRYSAAFKVSTFTPRDTASFEAMVSGWQARVYGVPWWMDAQPLKAATAIGDSVIQVDTALRQGFTVGGLIMLWRDQYTYEAATIQALTSSSITLSSKLTRAWTAGALVVPLRRGRLEDAVSIKRETSGVSTAAASFACEVV